MYKAKVGPTDNRRWGSIHQGILLIERDFSSHFDLNCTQYSHYLDAVMNKIDPFKDSTVHQHIHRYTGIEGDLFLPIGLYVGSRDQIPIIFNFGCSIAVILCKDDFSGPITPVNKTMIGLGTNAQVVGEGMVKWVFRYDYGVKKTYM